MKKWFLMLPALFLATALIAGCSDDAADDDDAADNSTSVPVTEVAATSACLACGQEAGEACCATDEAKCEKCGFVSDSVLCCTGLTQGEGQVCLKCGEEKGSEGCCDPDATLCACGMIKDSPLCCKLPKEDGSSDSDETAE